MEKTPRKSARRSRAGEFVAVKRASNVYINGNLVLKPLGTPSAGVRKLRSAVQDVLRDKK